MRHWSEPLGLCLGATASLFFFTVESPIHLRDGNWGLAMARCNLFFWLAILCLAGAWYTGTARPVYRVWALVLLVLLLLLPETRALFEEWLLR